MPLSERVDHYLSATGITTLKISVIFISAGLAVLGRKLHQDNENPALFIFYETWESPAHLEKHMNTDHFKSFVSVVGGMVEEIALHKMTKIA